jgi:DNA-binding NarL/FixJ family response regulator
MSFGVYLFFISFNIALVWGISHFQNRVMRNRIRRMKQEIQELEDLVVAIVAEIEEAVGAGRVIPGAAAPAKPKPAPARDFPSLPSSAPSSLSENRSRFSETEVRDPKHRQILDLRQQGMEVSQIARELGIGQGEILLILGLYKRS